MRSCAMNGRHASCGSGVTPGSSGRERLKETRSEWWAAGLRLPVFFMGNAVKVSWAVTQWWKPLRLPTLRSLFTSQTRAVPVMTGMKSDSIAKSACDLCAQWPGTPPTRQTCYCHCWLKPRQLPPHPLPGVIQLAPTLPGFLTHG